MCINSFQFGQGGNQAIESVAALINCLMEVISRSSSDGYSPSTLALDAALQKYQYLRQDRAKKFIKLSRIITPDEALDTLAHTLRFLFFPLPSTEQVAGDYISISSAKKCTINMR